VRRQRGHALARRRDTRQLGHVYLLARRAERRRLVSRSSAGSAQGAVVSRCVFRRQS
jgi:hypothetical protein